MKRSAGILLPVTSLPSPYGIGTLGRQAYQFADLLHKLGQAYWQVLPLGPTGFGDSPYQSFSSFAGNPYMIDLDQLAEEGLLQKKEYADLDWGKDPRKVDYGKIYNSRFTVLRKAVDRLYKNRPEDLDDFLKQEKFWLDDYAMYMSVKNHLGGKPVSEWPEDIRRRQPEAMARTEFMRREDIRFWKGMQYLFFKQWKKLRTYCNAKDIRIIGDLPIYVSQDSVEVWAHPEIFQMDENGKSKDVAGCPPDGFTADGQLWGNPLYDWDYLRKTDYAWWVDRIAQQMKFYDVLRIDHFRGFAGYYAIPAGDKNARRGVWKKGPGIDLFKAVEKKLGRLNIIAEDLGFLTEDVTQMLEESGFPGMKVLEFAFDNRKEPSAYLPHFHKPNCVVYPGTHDNETLCGWAENLTEEKKQYIRDYLHITDDEPINRAIIRTVYASTADTVILQYQDVLELGNEARMNEPSTTGKNWVWRMKNMHVSKEMTALLKEYKALYSR